MHIVCVTMTEPWVSTTIKLDTFVKSSDQQTNDDKNSSKHKQKKFAGNERNTCVSTAIPSSARTYARIFFALIRVV